MLTPDQIMVDGKPVAETALVYDCDGYFMGVSLAEKLAREGVRVTYVTPHASVAPFMHETGEAPDMLRLLRGLGVALVPSRIVERIEPGRVTSIDSFFETILLAHEVGSVVLVTQRVSSNGLSGELRQTPVGALYRIGDCVAPRLLPTRSSTAIASRGRSTRLTRPVPCPSCASAGSSGTRPTPTTTSLRDHSPRSGDRRKRRSSDWTGCTAPESQALSRSRSCCRFEAPAARRAPARRHRYRHR